MKNTLDLIKTDEMLWGKKIHKFENQKRSKVKQWEEKKNGKEGRKEERESSRERAAAGSDCGGNRGP